MDADFLINIPVLKGHCQVRMTCALKNLKGCIPDSEKRRYHTQGLHEPIASLNSALKQHFIIVDALQGDLTFEEGGTPVRLDRIFCGTDPVLIDRYGANLMGYSHQDVKYIDIAASLGVGKGDLDGADIVELGEKSRTAAPETPSGVVDSISEHIVQSEACSACYGTVVHALYRLKEQGKLTALSKKIYIGQGFQGEEREGLGIGKCSFRFSDNLPGCPPDAASVVRFILEHGSNN